MRNQKPRQRGGQAEIRNQEAGEIDRNRWKLRNWELRFHPALAGWLLKQPEINKLRE